MFCNVHSTLFKHEAQQISFIVRMDRIWCRLRQCVKQNTDCCKAHGASSQIPTFFSSLFSFFRFRSLFLFLFRFLSFSLTLWSFYLIFAHFTHDANFIWCKHTLTIVARHHSAIVHGFGIWFQCFINTECTSYVCQPIRWYKTISHFSTFPTMWLVFVFTPKPICAYTKYLWLHHSYLSDFEFGCWLFFVCVHISKLSNNAQSMGVSTYEIHGI